MSPAADAPNKLTSADPAAPARSTHIASAAPIDLTPVSAQQAVGRFSGIARADVRPRAGRITAIIGLLVLIAAIIGSLIAGLIFAFS